MLPRTEDVPKAWISDGKENGLYEPVDVGGSPKEFLKLTELRDDRDADCWSERRCARMGSPSFSKTFDFS